MTKFLKLTEAAEMARKILKEAYPRINFRVRSNTYDLGAAIYIDYWGGPTEIEIEDLLGILQGVDFMWVDRKLTAAMIKPIADELCACWHNIPAEIIDHEYGAYTRHKNEHIVLAIARKMRETSFSQALPSITRERIMLDNPAHELSAA